MAAGRVSTAGTPVVARAILEVEPRLKAYVGEVGSLSAKGCYDNFGRIYGLDVIWVNMMRRCYDPASPSYLRYGGRGVSVCPEWQNRATFVKDVKTLHGWANKERNPDGYKLDKDYYGSNQYSKDTCVWLSNGDNGLYTVRTRPVRVTAPGAEPQIYLSAVSAAIALAIPETTLGSWLTGARCAEGPYSFWTIEYYNTDKNLRHPLEDAL